MRRLQTSRAMLRPCMLCMLRMLHSRLLRRLLGAKAVPEICGPLCRRVTLRGLPNLLPLLLRLVPGNSIWSMRIGMAQCSTALRLRWPWLLLHLWAARMLILSTMLIRWQLPRERVRC